MITLYTDKKDCCGCTACMKICPNNAITMEPDEDGFLYPIINHESCVKCRLCRKVCAFQKISVKPKEPIATYVSINKNQATLLNSASGGIFPALASLVFEKNGVVFGCAYNKDMLPEHICIDNPADMIKMQGSKYVQSDINTTFAETKMYLKQGRQVLYTGTPCQIAGLKSYLGNDYDNLVTADLICHGVPSPEFFKGYIIWLEQKLSASIIDFDFRDKSKGWGYNCKVIYQKEDGIHEKLIPPTDSYYYRYFLKGDINRNCCYECKYAGGSRQGDFTIGDYWGIKKVHPDIETTNGVSVLLVNSKKGMQLMDRLSKYITLTKSNFKLARAHNDKLKRPTPKSKKREVIFKTFREKGPQAVADKYYREIKKQIIICRVKMLIPQPVKNVIKKIIGRG